eukprot:m.54380 g.54380  ORF g.54380 m.54380 type:complete len:332 (-) comp11410_c0_seq6:81-1076(-)
MQRRYRKYHKSPLLSAHVLSFVHHSLSNCTFTHLDHFPRSILALCRMKLNEIQRIDVEAVLDIKWLTRTQLNECPTLGIATASGNLLVFSLQGDTLVSVTELNLCSELALSLDWNDGKQSSSPIEVAVSDQRGHVSVLAMSSEGALEVVESWKAHEHPAWITAFNYFDTNIVYSGGDDCRFRGWDRRTGCSAPTFVSRRHDMGVCSMQHHRTNDHLLVTGSYDETVKLWDTRAIRQPVTEVNVGGGIWRLKWNPSNDHQDLLLCAAMHGGFHVVQLGEDESSLDVVSSLDTDGELAYGASWCWDPKYPSLVGSCTFYNAERQLWTSFDTPQ